MPDEELIAEWDALDYEEYDEDENKHNSNGFYSNMRGMYIFSAIYEHLNGVKPRVEGPNFRMEVNIKNSLSAEEEEKET